MSAEAFLLFLLLFLLGIHEIKSTFKLAYHRIHHINLRDRKRTTHKTNECDSPNITISILSPFTFRLSSDGIQQCQQCSRDFNHAYLLSLLISQSEAVHAAQHPENISDETVAAPVIPVTTIVAATDTAATTATVIMAATEIVTVTMAATEIVVMTAPTIETEATTVAMTEVMTETEVMTALLVMIIRAVDVIIAIVHRLLATSDATVKYQRQQRIFFFASLSLLMPSFPQLACNRLLIYGIDHLYQISIRCFIREHNKHTVFRNRLNHRFDFPFPYL